MENLSGLVGGLLAFSVAKKILCPSPALAKLRLCPGTLLIGLSSSTNFNLAVALATPHAGVGLSSGGEDDDILESSLIMLGSPVLAAVNPNPRKGVGRIGEIITKSSSPYCRVEGEGEGESLCFPLLDGKGDLNAMGEAAKGLGEARWVMRGLGWEVMMVEVEVDPNAGAANQVPGRFRPFVRGTRKLVLVEAEEEVEDEEDWMGSAVRCMVGGITNWRGGQSHQWDEVRTGWESLCYVSSLVAERNSLLTGQAVSVDEETSRYWGNARSVNHKRVCYVDPSRVES